MISELAVIDEVARPALRGIGVQVAVDDFGTGYSSLKFLTRVPVEEVKIDRTFVPQMVDVDRGRGDRADHIELAQQLDLRVIAEGVETAEQRAALTALGCTAAQGFLFYPPMPVDRVIAVLQELTNAKILKLARTTPVSPPPTATTSGKLWRQGSAMSTTSPKL